MLLAVAEQYSFSLIVYLMFLICCMIETNGSILAGSVRCCVLPRLHCGPSSSGHKAMCVSVTVCQAEAETEGAELSIALILALMFELANQTRTVAKKVCCVSSSSSSSCASCSSAISLLSWPHPASPVFVVGRPLFLAGYASNWDPNSAQLAAVMP